MQDGSGQEELITRTFKCDETNRAADVTIPLTGESVRYVLQQIGNFLLENSTMMKFHSSICSFEDVKI